MTRMCAGALATAVLLLAGCGNSQEDSPDYQQGADILAPGGSFEWGYNGGVSPTSEDCISALDLVLTSMPADAPEDEDAFLAGCNDFIAEEYN